MHRLDSPWQPGGQDGPAAPSALRALVVDGRIVVGKGSEGLRFAQWDLDSGAVRVFADHHDFDVDTVGTLELPGRSLFLVSPEAEAVALWDVVGTGTGERTAELNARCDRTAATGMLDHRPVLVTADEDGGPIHVWDLNDRVPLVGFDNVLETEEGEEDLLAVGLADVGGRPRVVAAGGYGSVVLGDIDSGEWGVPFAGPEPHDETDMLVDTGTANGSPIAVTCTYDPYHGQVPRPHHRHHDPARQVQATVLQPEPTPGVVQRRQGSALLLPPRHTSPLPLRQPLPDVLVRLGTGPAEVPYQLLLHNTGTLTQPRHTLPRLRQHPVQLRRATGPLLTRGLVVQVGGLGLGDAFVPDPPAAVPFRQQRPTGAR